MTMDRLGLALLSTLLAAAACTVSGKEIESSFFDPTANPSGTPPTTATPSETESTEGSEGPADTGSTSTAATTAATTTADGESTGMPPDEQPSNGMYSECAGVANCIGLTTCVLVAGGGFCSNTGCTDPLTQCDANPGATSTAPPACVDNGAGQFVCALSCAGGQTCPGGMECVALGASMVCA